MPEAKKNAKLLIHMSLALESLDRQTGYVKKFDKIGSRQNGHAHLALWVGWCYIEKAIPVSTAGCGYGAKAAYEPTTVPVLGRFVGSDSAW